MLLWQVYVASNNTTYGKSCRKVPDAALQQRTYLRSCPLDAQFG